MADVGRAPTLDTHRHEVRHLQREAVMSEVLVLYASTHGHTGRIAAGIGLALERAGAYADVRALEYADEIAPWRYDLVVVGASVHAGHHQKEIVQWVRRNAAALNVLPSAFFSVSLTAAEDTDEARRTTLRLIDEFTAATTWTPTVTRSFAGALQYLEYPLFTRFAMKMLMHRGGHPTDSSRDYDYTDWSAVERFGTDCAALIPVPVASP
jgi:menaquinone-dependent protoporphyrinogen oxidase